LASEKGTERVPLRKKIKAGQKAVYRRIFNGGGEGEGTGLGRKVGGKGYFPGKEFTPKRKKKIGWHCRNGEVNQTWNESSMKKKSIIPQKQSLGGGVRNTVRE